MRAIAIALLMVLAAPVAASEFAVEVIDYAPAPGQWVNNPDFNDPARALGPPVGGGTVAADNSSLISLGGFGGSITLRFDHMVADELFNPMGLDLIVYGNATWVGGDPQRRWAEPAHVEIMLDVDGNGVPGTYPDEIWYVLTGSLIDSPPDQYRQQWWDDDPGTPTPPADVNWFPPGQASPYATWAYEITQPLYQIVGEYEGVIVNPNSEDEDPDNDHLEGIWGYADLAPTLVLGDMNANNLLGDPQDEPWITPEEFYTLPDDPYEVGMTPRAGGGDAYNIADAIDPDTGLPANLPGFHFIRITTAVDALLGILGEASAEIDAVADVRAADCPGDLTADGVVNITDFTVFASAYLSARGDVNWLSAADFDGNGRINITDFTLFASMYGTVC